MSRRRLSVAPTLLLFLSTVFILFVIARCAQEPTTSVAAPRYGKVVVLMYHHLLPQAETGRYTGNSIVTTVEAFEQQLDWLQERHFATITPAMLEAFLYDEQPLPGRSVLITFDDGYLSNIALAYPLLQARGMQATVFAVTGSLSAEEQTFDTQAVQMMSASDLTATTDVFTYACHTHRLHTFSNGQAALVQANGEAVAQDLAASLQVLKSVPGATLTAFSYPYGLYDQEAQAALRAAGFRVAFIASAGVVTRQSDPYELPRCPVDSSVTMEDFAAYFSPILSG